MKEFKARGLDTRYEKEIKEWLRHKDEERFGKKLEAQMLKEIERFTRSRN